MRDLKLGLALGAGGTKGSAHVGVMRVLQEAGLRPEVVAGTSIGSLYGGAYATGYTPADMDEGIRTCPHLDVISFFRHRLKIRHNNRLARRFYSELAGHLIEDLPVRFAATASDIVEHKPVIIDRGPLIDAIEASIAIPLIARPVAHQGRFLLDGGFWDSAPVDAALQLGADVVVSVELGNPYQLPDRYRRPALWLAQRMQNVPLARSLAGIPFAISAVTRQLTPTRAAHVVIRPAVAGMNSNSPFHMKKGLQAGADAAALAIPAIRALLAGESPASVAEEFAPAPKLVTDPGMA